MPPTAPVLGSTLTTVGSRNAFEQIDRDYVIELARTARDAGALRLPGVSAAQAAAALFESARRAEPGVHIHHLPLDIAA